MPFRRTAVDFGVGGERGAFSKFFDSHGTVVVLAPESNFFFANFRLPWRAFTTCWWISCSKGSALIRTCLRPSGWSLPRATPKSANPSNRHRPQRLLQPQLRPSHRPTPHSCIHSLDVSTPFNWLPKSNLLLPSHRLALLALLLHHLIIKLCSDYAENFKERRQTFLL